MIYRFEGFMLDASTRRLLRQVQPLKVPMRVFDCLLFLIEHRDRAVSRDELIRNVWGRDTVTDNQLAQTILLARKLIGDEGNEQRFIRTVQGVGYHWVADVEQQSAALPEPSNETQAPVVAEAAANEVALVDADSLPTVEVIASTQTNRFSKRWIISGLAVLLAIVGVVFYWSQRLAASKASVELNQQATRILVMPVLVQDPEQSWARLGLMSLIADELQSRGIAVLPVENVLSALHSQPLSSANMRDKLKAKMAIEGTALQGQAGWTVTLHILPEAGQAFDIRVSDSELLTAARKATDALVRRLGGKPVITLAGRDPALANIRNALQEQKYDEARRLIARLSSKHSTTIEARLLKLSMNIETGHWQEAKDNIAQLFASSELIKSPIFHSEALLRRAELRRAIGDDDNLGDHDKAVALLDNAHTPQQLGNALLARGKYYWRHQKYDIARIDIVRARQLFEASADDIGVASADVQLGKILMWQEQNLEALQLLQPATETFSRYNYKVEAFQTLLTIIAVQNKILYWKQALINCDRAATLLASVPNSSPRQNYMGRCATVNMSLGNLDAASALLDSATQEQKKAESNSQVLANLGGYYAAIALEQDKASEALLPARVSFAAGLTLTKNKPTAAELRKLNRDWALQLLMHARFLLDKAPEVTKDEQDVLQNPETLRGQIARAYWLAKKGDFVNAESSFRNALKEIDANGYPLQARDASVGLIDILLRQNRLDEASDVIRLMRGRYPDMFENDYQAAILALRVAHARKDKTAWRSALDLAATLAGQRKIPVALLTLP